jgi:hypothetical protein
VRDMSKISYFLRYEDKGQNTAQEHLKVLQQYGKVIWGQWRFTDSLLCKSTYHEMNMNVPFYLYALDKKVAFIKMRVIQVLTKEEVINNNLQYLIPNYYTIETPCSAFYLIDEIEICAPEEAKKVEVISSHRKVYDSGQVKSTAPWKVQEIENLIVDYSNENNNTPKNTELCFYIQSLIESAKLFSDFSQKLYDTFYIHLEDFPIYEAFYFHLNLVHDLIIKERGFPILNDEESIIFEEIIMDFAVYGKSEYLKNTSDILNFFFNPDNFINEE